MGGNTTTIKRYYSTGMKQNMNAQHDAKRWRLDSTASGVKLLHYNMTTKDTACYSKTRIQKYGQ